MIRVMWGALFLAVLGAATTWFVKYLWEPPIKYRHNGITENKSVGETVRCDDPEGCYLQCANLRLCGFKHGDKLKEVHGGISPAIVYYALGFNESATIEWEH